MVTEYQTSGRGQIGNSWESEAGKNLLCSVFLKPVLLPVSSSFFLNMSVCLALADSLNEFHPGFVVKWPNDILFDGRKVCGVLIENNINGRYIQNSIVGIGLNINQLNFAYPHAVSLAQVTGRRQEVSHVLDRVLQHLEARYLQVTGNPGRLKEDYLNGLYGVHGPVEVSFNGKKWQAQVEDVKKDGELLLSAEGRHFNFRFKEVEFVF